MNCLKKASWGRGTPESQFLFCHSHNPLQLQPARHLNSMTKPRRENKLGIKIMEERWNLDKNKRLTYYSGRKKLVRLRRINRITTADKSRAKKRIYFLFKTVSNVIKWWKPKQTKKPKMEMEIVHYNINKILFLCVKY